MTADKIWNKIRNFEKELEDVSARLSTIERHNNELVARLEAYETEMNQKSSELNLKIVENEKIKEDYSSSMNMLTSCTQLNEDLGHKITEYTRRLRVFEDDLLQKDSDIETNKNIIVKLEAQLKEKTSFLEKADQRNLDLDNRLKNMIADTSTLKNELALVTSSSNKFEDECNNFPSLL